MKYLLNTHTWIWWNMNSKRLSAKVKRLISDPTRYEELLLSAISPWEFCKLLDKKSLTIACDSEEWMNEALDMPKLRLVPLSPTLSFKANNLPQPLHLAPADQIIVATAREENATILTTDQLILGYKEVKTLGPNYFALGRPLIFNSCTDHQAPCRAVCTIFT